MKGTVAFKLVAITLLAISTDFVSAGDEDLWNEFEKEDNGAVTSTGLKEGFQKKGITLNDEQVKEILHVADYNNDGTLSKFEFNEKAAPYLTYNNFDEDKNGYITKDELKEGFKKEGVDIKPERVEEMYKIADENHDEKINYREFVDNVLPYFKFDKFDADKTGFITKNELRNGFATYSITLNGNTLEHVFQVGDRNNDDHISYTEYVHRVDYFFIFHELDKEKSGSITANELKEGLAKYEITLTYAKALKLIDTAHWNKDCTVIYREFLDDIFPYFRFIKLNKSNSGELTKNELGEGLKLYGIILDDTRLTALFKVGDTNENYRIDYVEYVRKVDAIFYFRRFDKNNNGLLDKTELKEGFELHGLTLDTAQLDTLFAVSDSIKKDGQIDYEEFVDATYLYFVFRKCDTDKTGGISIDQLQKCMKYHGINLDGVELTQNYNTAITASANSSDNITYDGFNAVIKYYIIFKTNDKTGVCRETDT